MWVCEATRLTNWITKYFPGTELWPGAILSCGVILSSQGNTAYMTFSVFLPLICSRGLSTHNVGFEVWINEMNKMTDYSWKSEPSVHIFPILTSRKKTKPTPSWLIYFKEGKVKVWWEEKRSPSQLIWKPKRLSPVGLETAISLYFLNSFTFPKGFNLYLNEKSFPSFLYPWKYISYIKMKNRYTHLASLKPWV